MFVKLKTCENKMVPVHTSLWWCGGAWKGHLENHSKRGNGSTQDP